MSEKCGIAWGDGLLQMDNRGKGNMLLSRERDLRWLVNMVAMFRCVYAEEAGKKLGCWGNRGGAGDRRTKLAGSRLVSILSYLLGDKKLRKRFCESDYGECLTTPEAIASIILFIYEIYVFLPERDSTTWPTPLF